MVVVAVLTYRRPDDLAELLPMLLAEAESVQDGWVLVVDNDPAASAAPIVDDLLARQQPSGALRYVVEPAVGIAAARNRALQEAAGSRLLAFIDDDERPEPGWLAALVACHAEHGATAVAGAVVPDVGRIDDPWIREGGFFQRKRHPTGDLQNAASTANLLIDLQRLGALGPLTFDPRLGLTGGSDTLFTRQLVALGGTIVWCDEAVVTDRIRSARLTRAWVLQRHFRAGNGSSRIEVRLASGAAQQVLVRLRMTGSGSARVVVGCLRAAYGRVRGSYRHQARGSRTVARGVGMVSGAWGLRYVEYRRVPGS